MSFVLTLIAGIFGGHLLPRLHRGLRRFDLFALGNTLIGGAGGGFCGALAAALGLAPVGVGSGLAALFGGAGAVALIAWARTRLDP